MSKAKPQRSLESHASVSRWMNQVFSSGISSEPTKRNYLHFLGRYTAFMGKNPDDIIAERQEDLRSQEEIERRRHEEQLQRFQLKLREEGLAPGSVRHAHAVIKSFYRGNYCDLKLKTPRDRGKTRIRKVPTPSELQDIVEAADNSRDKALVMVLAQSGMGIGELPQATFRVVESQMEDEGPLHLHLVRHKTSMAYDSFLGRDAKFYVAEYLRDLGSVEDRNPLFGLSKRQIEHVVENLSKAASLKPHSTPHKLRSFFETYLTLAGCPPPLINYWMGHKDRYDGAYFVPPVEQQREIYVKFEHAISLPRPVLQEAQP